MAHGLHKQNFTEQESEAKKERQIEEIQNRIVEKYLGETGSIDAQLLTLIQMGKELHEQTQLLRKIAKQPDEPVKKSWWKRS